MTRLTRGLTLAAGVALLAWLALPARAASPAPAFGSYALTVVAGSNTTDGTVAPSGGLVTLDSGSAYVRGRLDSGPSSSVQADNVEPGTDARSVIGTANSCPGAPVCTPQVQVVYPDAEASYPGRGQADVSVAPTTTAGVVTVGAGSASARAGADQASGSASGSSYGIPGVFGSSGANTAVTMSHSGDQLSVTGTAGVTSLAAPGGLTLTNVRGVAGIQVAGGKRTVVAGVTVGSASVAGTAVTIDDSGVTVATQQVPLGAVQQTTQQVNQALSAAGVSVHALAPVKSTTATGAIADSGGVVITITTPAQPAGVNTFVMRVGRVVATETDAPPEPAFVEPQLPPAPPTTTTTTITIPGAPGSAGVASVPAPAQPLATRYLVVGGARISALQALVAFALWQVLTLTGPTATTLVRRRRRERSGTG